MSSQSVINKGVSTPEDSVGETTSELAMTRANIESLGDSIRLTDSDESNNLELFCYVKCGLNDTSFLKRCRGVLFHGNELVMNAFPYTSEFTSEQVDRIKKHDFSSCHFFDSYEGTLIRVFCFNSKWYTSTHRKLNAFRSKWASRESFGSAFIKALEAEEKRNEAFRLTLNKGDSSVSILNRFYTTLNPNKQYMFLVRNTAENRIVCSPPEQPTLYHVGTFVDRVLTLVNDINIPTPKKHNFSNEQELVDYVNNIDIKNLQGVIAFGENNTQFKVLHPDYHEFFRARGNEPSIKYRYLQVRMNQHLVHILTDLYPEYFEMFKDYENIIYEISRNIYNSYVSRFIKKQYVTLQQEEYHIMRDCHSWHLQNRDENRISLDRVIDEVNKQNPTNLNHMIRHFNTEQKRKQEPNNSNNPLVLPSPKRLLAPLNKKE